MKHTPGPWTVSPEWPFPDNQGRKHDAVVVKYGNGNEALICSFEHGVMRDSQNADARLIAAAPDMLEALNGLFEHCSMIHKHWGDNSNQKEAENAIKKARAAINKATGK